MRVIGVVPARMDSSRFYGKPLHKIKGKPMIEHVYERSKFSKNLDLLVLSSCDKEIEKFAKEKEYNYISTGKNHVRALDRIAEVGDKLGLNNDDIIINIQGDEPMLDPKSIDLLIQPLIKNQDIHATVLGMEIKEENIWRDPDIVKIIHNEKNQVLYTSRAPVPYGSKFSKNLKAKRICGIFAFRFEHLKIFNNKEETFLEKIESCDSNRILDLDFSQYLVSIDYFDCFSVDKPEDVHQVEKYLEKDKYWGKY